MHYPVFRMLPDGIVAPPTSGLLSGGHRTLTGSPNYLYAFSFVQTLRLPGLRSFRLILPFLRGLLIFRDLPLIRLPVPGYDTEAFPFDIYRPLLSHIITPPY